MTRVHKRSYTLYGLLLVTFLAACGAALVRFVVTYPDMMPPVIVVGFFIGVLVSPAIVSRIRRRFTRVVLGCFLLPIVYLLAAMAFASLVFWIRSRSGLPAFPPR